MNLNDSDAHSQHDEGQPFGFGQPFPKHEDGKECGRKNLHLVCDLKSGDVEIRGGDVLKVVLEDIEDGRNGELVAIGRKDGSRKYP